jgi:hypothetical protein
MSTYRPTCQADAWRQVATSSSWTAQLASHGVLALVHTVTSTTVGPAPPNTPWDG